MNAQPFESFMKNFRKKNILLIGLQYGTPIICTIKYSVILPELT